MTERTAEKVKNSESVIFGGGHFPTSEDPVKFKAVVTPVLKKIAQNDPERRGQGAAPMRSNGPTDFRGANRNERPAGRRSIEL